MNYLDVITKKYDRGLIITASILVVFGIIMLYSASSSLSLSETNGRTDTLYLQAHLKRLLIGITFLFVFTLINYRYLKPIAKYALLCAIALLIWTKVSFLLNGSNAPARWLYIGDFSLQTSDLARLAMIIFIAAFIDSGRDRIKQFYEGYLPIVAIIAIPAVLIMLQPDYSTAIMLGLIGITMLFLGGARLSHLMVTISAAMVVAVPLLMMAPYRRARIFSWFNGNEDLASSSYQINQSLISLGNGNIFGLGLGNSMEKNLFLPTPHTDFILSIIGEELGLLGTLLVLTLFIIIFQRGIKIAKEANDAFGVFLALGISISIISYAFINAAVVTNIIPVTGLPLPLISYGGTSMLVHLIGIGILLNISQGKRSIRHRTGWKPKLHG
jgi:cell division protein FtsW